MFYEWYPLCFYYHVSVIGRHHSSKSSTVQHALSFLLGSKLQAERIVLHSVGFHPALDLRGDFYFNVFFKESWSCELILTLNKSLSFKPNCKGTLMSIKNVSAKLEICSTCYILVEIPSRRRAFSYFLVNQSTLNLKGLPSSLLNCILKASRNLSEIVKLHIWYQSWVSH